MERGLIVLTAFCLLTGAVVMLCSSRTADAKVRALSLTEMESIRGGGPILSACYDPANHCYEPCTYQGSQSYRARFGTWFSMCGLGLSSCYNNHQFNCTLRVYYGATSCTNYSYFQDTTVTLNGCIQ